MLNKLLVVSITGCALMTPTALGVIALNSPTSDWYAIQYLAQSDAWNDEQTGINEADLVGSSVGASVVQTAFYFRYDGTSNQIGFRLRLDADSNPPGYTGALWVGFMFDAGDSVDLFAGYINKGPTTQIGLYNPGTGANTSPSTTTINDGSPIYSESVTAANFLYTPVTVGLSGNDNVSGGVTDISADGNVDYFATWVLPFAQLQAAATSRGFTITPTTAFRFVVGTSEQSNSMNQDLNGVTGGATSTSTFSTLGAISPTVTTSGGVVTVPEPSTALLAAIVPLLWVLRRRR